MIKFLNRWLGKLPADISKPTEIESENLRHMAFANGLDRRRFPRVLLPANFPTQYFPKFIYQGKIFEIRDLSLGGVCLVDPDDLLKMDIGQPVEIQCVTQEYQETISFQLAGVSFQKKHFEFKNLPSNLVSSFSKIVEVGLRGQKMQRSLLSVSGQVETSVIELWVGIDGSHFCFQSDPKNFAKAEITLEEKKDMTVSFQKGSLPLYGGQIGLRRGRILDPEDRAMLSLYFMNFPFISPRLSNLLDSWSELEQLFWDKAGSF